MHNKDPEKWYFKSWSLIVFFLCVGPFMLPLLWVNPRLSKRLKIIISVVIIVITFLLTSVLVSSLKAISGYYQMLSS